MNVELLEQIADVIVAKPQEFNMERWHETNRCGTTHCIAGWAEVIEYGTEFSGYYTPIAAAKILNLSPKQACLLFYVEDIDGSLSWPQEYVGKENIWCPNAEQAAARIRHFIATDGRE